MITASHNPAAYNGYKVYGEDGGQMPPADADALTAFVREIENPLEIPVLSEEEAKHSGLITIIGEEVDTAYLKEVKTVTIDQKLIETTGKNLKLVYTPLHGTGRMLGEKALKQAGFDNLLLNLHKLLRIQTSVQSSHQIQKNILPLNMRLLWEKKTQTC